MGEERASNGVLVLIAEDDLSIARIIAMIVEDLGHAARVAHNGAEALALVRMRRPALLITDLMMPVLDGAGLLEQIRAEGMDGFPVILVTAVPRERARSAGADAVLPKPFDIAALEQLITRFLGDPADPGPDEAHGSLPP